MPCFKPLVGYRALQKNVSGKRGLVFRKSEGVFSSKPVFVPCGRCIGCRLEYSRQWAIRCVHEAQMHEENCFLTLTYDDEHLPGDRGLVKKHFQDFMKRLRAKYPGRKIKYFHCGEYGEDERRPHYHALLFGFDFPDKIPVKKMRSGCKVFSSDILFSLWSFGFSSIGAVTFESAAYVARYVVKKITGEAAEAHYQRVIVETGEVVSVLPEYVTMSLKPAIGAEWLDKFGSDVFPSDEVIIKGRSMKPPKYYASRYEVVEPELIESIKFRRVKASLARKEDSSPWRLRDREIVQNAKVSLLKRKVG